MDAICDGRDVFVPGIMELVERTGVHSGDSISVYPTFSISDKVKGTILQLCQEAGPGHRHRGPVQHPVHRGQARRRVYHRGQPPLLPHGALPVQGHGLPSGRYRHRRHPGHSSLKEQGIFDLYPQEKKRRYVKVPVFSFAKIRGLDAYLSPEMKSTGEAIGYDDKLPRAMYKALQAAGMHVQNYGTVLVTLADEDKAGGPAPGAPVL